MARRRSENRRAGTEPPTPQVLLSGGLGVFAVVVFVAALVFGIEVTNPPPGGRLGVTSSAGPAGIAVLVPRCRAERVTVVELRDADDAALWRIVARKGSIDERYVVGAETPPFGFDVEVPFTPPLPPALLTVVAQLEGEPFDSVDQVDFVAEEVPADGVLHLGEVVEPPAFEARAAAAADCQGSSDDLGLVNVVFIVAAAGVVVTYLLMVGRFVRSRR